jgi:hypothetical protein
MHVDGFRNKEAKGRKHKRIGEKLMAVTRQCYFRPTDIHDSIGYESI